MAESLGLDVITDALELMMESTLKDRFRNPDGTVDYQLLRLSATAIVLGAREHAQANLQGEEYGSEH